MAALFLSEYSLYQVLAWTLVHSLWQGLLLALVVGFFLMATRKANPAFRYRVLLALECLFLVAVAGSFFSLSRDAGAQRYLAPAGMIPRQWPGSLVSKVPIWKISQQGWQGLGHALVAGCNQYADWICGLWILACFFKLLQLSLSLRQNQILRHRHLDPAPGFWQERLRQWQATLGIRRPVMLGVSSKVNSPVHSGIWKPCILVPLGMFLQLSPEQTEAVLLHELAHIRRHDYLINLLQHGVDLLFFFNPGLRWVNTLIRQEREHCCDEQAICYGKDPKTFISALLLVQERSLQNLEPALGLSSRPHQILRRIHRILSHHNQTLSTMEKLFLSGGLLAVTAVVLAFGKPHATPALQPNPAEAVAPSRIDTLPSPAKAVTPVVTPVEGKQSVDIDGYRLVLQGDQILEASRDGKKLTAGELKAQEPHLREILNQARQKQKEMQETMARDQEKMAREQSEMALKLQREAAQQQALAGQLVQKEIQEEMQKQQKMMLDQIQRNGHIDAEALQKQIQEQSALQNEWIKRQMEQQMASRMEEAQKLLSLDLVQNQKEQMEKEIHENLMRSKVEMEKVLREQLENQKSVLMDAEKTTREQFEIQKEAMETAKKAAERHQGDQVQAFTVFSIARELVDRNLIPDSKNYSFELSATKFEVNGKRQPAALQEEFSGRYIHDKKDFIRYEQKNGEVNFNTHLKP